MRSSDPMAGGCVSSTCFRWGIDPSARARWTDLLRRLRVSRHRAGKATSRAFADRRGSTAVEFGLLLPVMLTTILGSFQIYSIVRAKMVTVNAARVLADIISQQTSVGTTTIADFCKAAQLSMNPLPASFFAASIASVSKQSSARKVDWTDKTCGSVAAIANAATTATNVTPNDSDTAIVVQATYTVSLPYGFPLPSTYTVSATALASPRSGNAVKHS